MEDASFNAESERTLCRASKDLTKLPVPSLTSKTTTAIPKSYLANDSRYESEVQSLAELNEAGGYYPQRFSIRMVSNGLSLSDSSLPGMRPGGLPLESYAGR